MQSEIKNDEFDKESLSSGFANPWFGFISGLFIGTVATILLDPRSGSRRRALIRDKGVRLRHGLSDMSNKAFKNMRNKAQGIYSKTKMTNEEPLDDRKLVDRVRSEFGRVVRHTRPLRVEAHDGVVTLSGPILADEVDALLSKVKKVHGVKDVINNLVVHQSSEGISALQGEGPAYLQ